MSTRLPVVRHNPGQAISARPIDRVNTLDLIAFLTKIPFVLYHLCNNTGTTTLLPNLSQPTPFNTPLQELQTESSL